MPEEPVIRLSVRTLEELIQRAPRENYVLAHDQDGNWVKIVPYDPDRD